jgi:hypothetical protein
LLHFTQLFGQLFLLAVGFGQRSRLLFDNAFQLGFLRLLRFLQGCELIDQRIAGGGLVCACCFTRPYRPTPAASAMAMAIALSARLVLLLPFFFSAVFSRLWL